VRPASNNPVSLSPSKRSPATCAPPVLTIRGDKSRHGLAVACLPYRHTILDALEDQPHTPAADTVNAARTELRCAQSVRTEGLDGHTPPTESPATTRVGDTGLEPVTSALSRRKRLVSGC
jgi:hypothetical protein